jgi:hypothetical protein
MKNVFFSTLCASFLLASPSFAEHHESMAGSKAGMAHMKAKMHQRFSEIDSNGDEKISFDEQVMHCKQKFTDRDGNKDGFLTKDEINYGWKHKGAAQPITPSSPSAQPISPNAPIVGMKPAAN